MTRFHLILALVFGSCWLTSAPSRAQDAQPPFAMAKQYSAALTITTKGGLNISSQANVDGDKMRSEMEMNGMKMATIIRKDKLKIYEVMPAQKMVLQMDYDESKFKGQVAAAFGTEGKFELVGPEVVDGVASSKYKVTSDKTHQVFFFWLDMVNKAPVKMEAEDKSFSVEWKSYKPGPQSPDLFEIPAGYQVMDMPSMPGMPGGGGEAGGQ